MKSFSAIFCALLLLTGCDKYPATEAGGQRVATLPVMQDVIARQIPLFDGEWNASIMDNICKVADDTLTVEEFQSWFIKHGVNIKALAAKDPGFRFLAGAGKPALVQACAAWMVASLSAPVQARGDLPEDANLLNEKMSRQTPVVKAIIDNLSNLAAEVSARQDYISEEDFRREVYGQFKTQAPQLVDQALKASFSLKDYYQPGSHEMIYQYRLKDGRMQVLFNGAQWLSAEKIKGRRYWFTFRSTPSTH